MSVAYDLRRANSHLRCSCGTHIYAGDQYIEFRVGERPVEVECRACAVLFARWPIPNGGVEQR